MRDRMDAMKGELLQAPQAATVEELGEEPPAAGFPGKRVPAPCGQASGRALDVASEFTVLGCVCVCGGETGKSAASVEMEH